MKRNTLLASIALLAIMEGCDPHLEHLMPIPNPADETHVSYANFTADEIRIAENAPGETVIAISLSETLKEAGSITISIQPGTGLITTPLAIDGRLVLSAVAGRSAITFSIKPIDNNRIDGDQTIRFKIIETTGAIVRGEKTEQRITITDDDLAGRPRSYESHSGSWRIKTELTYDAFGRILYRVVEKSTPATSSTKQTYSYDSLGHIHKIADGDTEIVYVWNANRIVRSETTYMGTLKSYAEFDYDANGNVSKASNYFRQPDGSFPVSFANLYTYHDGNLSRTETRSNQGELLSIETYDGFIDAINPFPMVEIHPAVKTQRTLPTRYTITKNGVTLEYPLSYEFSNGLVTARMSKSEMVIYTYY